MNCFGKYKGYMKCLICVNESGCRRYSNKEDNNMGYAMKEETKQERKERLDKEWEKRLPCASCHPKMKRLCKHYNTFKRPDYNTEQFSIGEIRCDDRIDESSALDPFKSATLLHGSSGGDMRS